MVKTRIIGGLERSLLLFTPHLEKQHILLPDAAIEGQDGSLATMTVEYHGMQLIHLHKGTTLGTVEEVTSGESISEGKVCGSGMVSGGNVGDLLPDADPPDVTVLRIEPASEPEDLEVTESGETSRSDTVTNTRAQRLLDQLALCLDNLSTAEREQLIELITSFADIFALDASELGTTTVVKHVINTGDHTPSCEEDALRSAAGCGSDGGVDVRVGCDQAFE